jgi:hypothetical protein
MLQANGLLHAAERYRAMLEAYKCGDEEALRGIRTMHNS